MGNNTLNIDKILKDLEKVKTAEQVFAENLNEPVAEVVKVAEPVQEEVVVEVPEVQEVVETPEVAEVTEVVETPEVVTEVAVIPEEEKTAELEKVAAEWDAKGRILARSFMNELEKLANTENVEVTVDPVVEATPEVVTPVEEVKTASTEETGKDLIMSNLINLYLN